jgi:rare lipoprotein A
VVISTHSGEASWYGPGFYGNRTANGEIYRQGTMTAAHRTLPFGTKVRVTNLWNGRSAVIRINDRGPFVAHRVIDLGHGAASTLGLTSSGIADVRLEVLR